MGLSNINIKLPDFSKIDKIKSDVMSKITSSDIGSSLKGKMEDMAGGYKDKISNVISDKMGGIQEDFASKFQIPNLDTIDMGDLDIGNIDMNSQMQEYLNGLDISSFD